MGEMHRQMEERYAPVIQYMQTGGEGGSGGFRDVSATAASWFGPLLFSVAQSLLANGAQFRNEQEMMLRLPGVESVIKVSNPQLA
jgi:hypothetical protein